MVRPHLEKHLGKIAEHSSMLAREMAYMGELDAKGAKHVWTALDGLKKARHTTRFIGQVLAAGIRTRAISTENLKEMTDSMRELFEAAGPDMQGSSSLSHILEDELIFGSLSADELKESIAKTKEGIDGGLPPHIAAYDALNEAMRASMERSMEMPRGMRPPPHARQPRRPPPGMMPPRPMPGEMPPPPPGFRPPEELKPGEMPPLPPNAPEWMKAPEKFELPGTIKKVIARLTKRYDPKGIKGFAKGVKKLGEHKWFKELDPEEQKRAFESVVQEIHDQAKGVYEEERKSWASNQAKKAGEHYDRLMRPIADELGVPLMGRAGWICAHHATLVGQVGKALGLEPGNVNMPGFHAVATLSMPGHETMVSDNMMPHVTKLKHWETIPIIENRKRVRVEGEGTQLFPVLSNLGEDLLDAKKFAEAELVLREAMKLNPKEAEIHEFMARALRGQRKDEEAEIHREKARALKKK